METIMISTILVNICIGCFACVGLTMDRLQLTGQIF